MTEMEKDVTFRTAVYSDLPSIMELCRSTGRFVCFDEVSTWMQSDPGCFFVAEISADEDPEIIALCCGLRLGPELGKMALYTVHENYRRRGIGKKIWNRAMERLEGRNIGVRAFNDLFQFYKERYGFQHESKVAVYQCLDGSKLQGEGMPIHGLSFATVFEGQLIEIQSSNGGNRRISSLEAGSCQNVTIEIEDGASNEGDAKSSSRNTFSGDIEKPATKLNNEDIIPATNKSIVSPSVDTSTKTYNSYISRITNQHTESDAVDSIAIQRGRAIEFNLNDLLDTVVNYDRRLHSRECSFLVRQTFSWKSCKTNIAISKESKVVGYGCFRECISNCWLLSPLYADTPEIAEFLLRELLRDFDFRKAPDGIQICFPDKNICCADLLKRLGFQDTGWCVFTGFTKEGIRLETDKIYSFHSIDV